MTMQKRREIETGKEIVKETEIVIKIENVIVIEEGEIEAEKGEKGVEKDTKKKTDIRGTGVGREKGTEKEATGEIVIIREVIGVRFQRLLVPRIKEEDLYLLLHLECDLYCLHRLSGVPWVSFPHPWECRLCRPQEHYLLLFHLQ